MDVLTAPTGAGALARRASVSGSVFEPLRLDVEPGHTLIELMTAAEIPEALLPHVALLLNGRPVPGAIWESTFTLPGDVLTIGVVPAGGEGGKQVFAALAVLAIAVAAPYLAGVIAPAAVTAGTATAGQALLIAGLKTGITLVGALVVSALVPPPALATSGGGRSQLASPGEAPTYRVGGQSNSARLWSTVKRVYGSYRVFADLAAVPLVDNVGRKSTISGLYYFSIGDAEIEDLRFGDQPFDTYGPRYRVLQNSLGQDLRLVSRSVGYEDLGYTLDAVEWLALQTKADSVKAIVDITFPGGLVRMNRAERLNATVPLQVRWRAKGSGDPWEYLGARDFLGAPAANSGGETWVVEYEPHIGGGGITSGQCIAWVVQTRTRSSGGAVTRILIYRNGTQIYQSPDFDLGTEPNQVRTGGTTYAAGAFPGDITQSEDDKSEVYAELLRARPIDDNAVRITNNTRELFTVGAEAVFEGPGVYEVQVRRPVPPSESDAVIDVCAVSLLRSYAAGPVLRLAHRASMVELEVVASDQLSGTMPPVNARVTSRLRRFDGNGFTGEVRESGNPAEIAVDLLTGGPHGTQTRYPLKREQIEFSDFVRLRNVCSQQVTNTVNGVEYTGPRFRWNGVIETDMPLGAAVNSVLSIARAQLRFTASGKLGVFIDELQDQPRALITQANSWSFRGSRPFAAQPHGLRINFTDRERDYVAASVAVYNRGYAEATATAYEDLDAWGVTSFPEAWRLGRYMLKQAILRSESFEVSQDAENLVVQRGELVTVQHDVPLHGGLAARVASVDGNVVVLDRLFEGAPTGYVNRGDTGVITSGAVEAVLGEDSIRVAAGHAISRGDLITLGQLGTVTQDYLVRSIEPGEDFSARLRLVKYDPEVYSDEAGPLPPWDPGFGDSLVSGAELAATALTAVQGWSYDPQLPRKDVALAWRITGDQAAYHAAVLEWRRNTTTWTDIGRVTGGARKFVHRIGWDERAVWSERVEYRIRPFTALGSPGKPATVEVQLGDYASKPLPPRSGFLDVRGQEITITWQFSKSPDIRNYLIRYRPRTDGTPRWHGATTVAELSYDENSTTFKARTGTYMLRAVNYAGILSDVVYLRTTIEVLPDLNVIETIDDAAAGWPGSIYRFTTGGVEVTGMTVRLLDGGELAVPFVMASGQELDHLVRTLEGGGVDISRQVLIGEDALVSDADWQPDTTEDQAIYTFAEVLDLGAVYEVLLQARIEAYAFNDAGVDAAQLVMALLGGARLRGVAEGDIPVASDDVDIVWNAWAEYRSADTADPIRVWGPIDAHGPLATTGIIYGPWRRFLASQATMRYLQLRIVAESEQDGVRIVVPSAAVEVDMPDRQWTIDNVPIQAGGSVVSFDPAFAARPVLAVTIEGATTAIRYQAAGLTRNSVEITLFNEAGASVAGQIDLAALGYGKEREEAI